MDTKEIDPNSRFLARTLHEVRTPIQTIISTVELLEETNLDTEQLEYVHQIRFGADILLQLANDVLDFAKLQTDEFKLENIPFDIIELIEHVVDLVSIEAFNKRIEVITDIDYSIPHTIMGDPSRVQQILMNLVKNAVKFTERGYFIVRLSHHSNDLYFEVEDSGIGIDIEKQSLIFKDFYQIDASTTRKFGGAGLGLAICKRLTEAMNGKIGVRNNPKGGSIFWFSIPCTFANLEVEELSRLTVPKGTRILLVDDNAIALQSMANKFLDFGIKSIETANSGSQALLQLEAAAKSGFPYTIIYVDMCMPKMDGWRLASEIHNKPNIPPCKKILMIPEGQMNGDAKMKILDWYNGYIYKPLKRNKILESLKDCVELDEKLTDSNKQNTVLPKIIEQKTNVETVNNTAMNDSDLVKGSKILVAEDHPVNRKIIETFLKKYGAEVYLAEDGQQAVEQIEEHPNIDMIFMDILMPIKSGTDATVELRHKNYEGIIIACTANNNPTDLVEFQKLGINDILIKPFKRETIRQILEKWNAVLSLPKAKEIVGMTHVNNIAGTSWDINDFMDTVRDDKDLAISLMEEYIKQTARLLEQIQQENSRQEINFEHIAELGHTLKGSSAAVSANKMAEYGKKINDAANTRDSIAIEANRTACAIDFNNLQEIIENWKTTVSLPNTN